MRYKKDEITALEKIYTATSNLIKQKDYNSINVSEIIKLSNISRSTFYFYFKNKEQIITEICNSIFKNAFKNQNKIINNENYSKYSEEDLMNLFTKSFINFSLEKELVLSILNGGASNIFLKQLRKILKPIVISLIEKNIIGNHQVPMELKIHQYINGYVGLVQFYLRHGENFSPNEISKYYFEIYY